MGKVIFKTSASGKNISQKLTGCLIVPMLFLCLTTSCKKTNTSSSQTDNQEEKITVYQSGETFQVENFGRDKQKRIFNVKAGTVVENGQEVENWVSAKNENEAAGFLLMMYSQDLDFMKICSKNMDKNKISSALSDWKSLGGYFIIGVDKDNNIVFQGGTGDMFDLKGKGQIKVNTIQEKGINIVTGTENEGKYVITDIEFNK